jgi:hypothetical protein
VAARARPTNVRLRSRGCREEAFRASAPRASPALEPHVASPSASCDLGVPACPPHDFPCAGAHPIAVSGADPLDPEAHLKGPSVTLKSLDAIRHDDPLPVPHRDVSGEARLLCARVALEGSGLERGELEHR